MQNFNGCLNSFIFPYHCADIDIDIILNTQKQKIYITFTYLLNLYSGTQSSIPWSKLQSQLIMIPYTAPYMKINI